MIMSIYIPGTYGHNVSVFHSHRFVKNSLVTLWYAVLIYYTYERLLMHIHIQYKIVSIETSLKTHFD